MRIPSLEDLSIWRRIAVALVILFIAAMIVLGLSLVLDDEKATGAPQPRLQSAIPGQPASTWDSRMFALDRDATDAAYVEHLKKLILVALSRPDDPHSFERAVVGAINTRKAYIAIMEGIDKREKASEEELTRRKVAPQ